MRERWGMGAKRRKKRCRIRKEKVEDEKKKEIDEREGYGKVLM